MPFRWGIPYVGFFVAVTLLGFWQSYFSPIGSVPLAFHVHALSALAWLALLIAQTWSIHNRRNQLHKSLGKASFVLFPFLILGLVMIVNLTASRYLAGEGSRVVNGPTIGALTFVAIFAYLTLFYLAMKHRRHVKRHAGYMLATPLILFESPASRAMPTYLDFPAFPNRTDLQSLADSIAVPDIMAIVFALAMYSYDRRNGSPWLVAAVFIGVQVMVVYTADSIPGFIPFFTAYGALPGIVTVAGALLAGGLAGWLGWVAGRQDSVTSGPPVLDPESA